MTDSTALREIIKRKGLKMNYLAEQLGLSDYGFALKVDGKNEFKTSEVARLCDLLSITSLKEKEGLFFAKNVE